MSGMKTLAVYWDEPLRRDLESAILDSYVTDDIRHIVVDSTIFYPRGGGQPGDTGVLQNADGISVPLLETIKTADDIILHRADAQTAEVTTGMRVHLILDWERRRRLMRTHTAMHLLCAAVDAPVTGSSMDELRGRIDFDCAALDKNTIETQMNAWVNADVPINSRWVDVDELTANPSWVRTISVSPPRHNEQVRLVEIGDIDLQTCGGTHVSSSKEVGAVQVIKIEKKGRQNRRVVFTLQDDV